MSTQEEDELIEAVLAVRKVSNIKTVTGLAFLSYALKIAQDFDRRHGAYILSGQDSIEESFKLAGQMLLADETLPPIMRASVAIALTIVTEGQFNQDLVEDVVKL